MKVRASLLLGHRHANRNGVLFLGVDGPVIVRCVQNEGRPLVVDSLVVLQGWNRRKSHSHWAANSVFALVPYVTKCGARHVCTELTPMSPGERMRLGFVYEAHQFVVSGVKLN